jgi:hypothetical protein
MSDSKSSAADTTGKAKKRPLTGAAAERKNAKAEAAQKKEAAERQAYLDHYEKLRTDIGTSDLRKYDMKLKFELANAIQHPSFGLGFVTKVTSERIEVAFEQGGRSLVHNRA